MLTFAKGVRICYTLFRHQIDDGSKSQSTKTVAEILVTMLMKRTNSITNRYDRVKC